MKTALIIVDPQNDFCENGSLEVPKANEIIPKINKLMKEQKFDLIIATQDYHPQNHSSFKINSEKGIWPVHCVQGSFGADFNSELNSNFINKVIQKGTNPNVDSYSGFFDNDKISSTGLSDYLFKNNITNIVVVGLALDYCVKATAIDGYNLGFHTTVLSSLTKAVNLSPNDGSNAIKEMKNIGIIVNE